MNKVEKIFTFNFNIILVLALSLFTLFNALLFFLPIYIIDIGGSETAVGFAAGVFMLLAVISRPFTGPLLDKYGNKKIMLICMAVFSLGNFLYIWANSVFFIFLLRGVQGVAWGCLVSGVYALAADLAPESRRVEALGYFAVMTSLGASIGPAATESIYLNSNSIISFITLGVTALFCILFLVILREKSVVNLNSNAVQKKKITLFTKSVIGLSFIGMLLAFCSGSVLSFLPILGQTRDIGSVGIFFTIQGIVMVIGRLFGGLITKRFGLFPILKSSIFITFIAMLIISFAPNILYLLLAAALFGAGLAFNTPALMALAVDMSSEEERGRAMSTLTGFLDMGIGIGSIGVGFLLTFTNITIVFLFGAGLLLFNLFFINYQERLYEKRISVSSIGNN